MKFSKRFAAVMLSIMMVMTLMPAMAFAEDADDAAEDYQKENAAVEEAADDSDTGYADLTFSRGIDPDNIEGADPDQLLEKFFLSRDTETGGIFAPIAPLSVKGDRLTGNNLKYYKYYKTIIKEVSSGKRTTTTKKVSLSKFLGKRRFTAKQLGVKRIGYKKNGRWYVSKAAEKKIEKLVGPGNWKKVYQGLLSDFSSESYWADWYTEHSFIKYHCPYYYNANSITFDKNDWIEFCLPVMPEFAKAKTLTYNYVYKVDKNKLNDAKAARDNARRVVETFDNEVPTTFAGYSPEAIDVSRMWYYCRVIAALNAYDHYSASLDPEDRYWHGPWSMISVFDNSPDTNAVCAGYARAFKYLCDLSTFESDWIDCQIATGSAGGTDTSHMWNIVRMNDGLNYVVDPTWIDNDTSGEADSTWFLIGAPYGSADSFTIAGNYREYDDWTKSVFAKAERVLSTKEYYELGSDREISLKGTKIRKAEGKKRAVKVRWNKVSSPLGALYVDGYQIQYSTNKNFKGAKKVTVKGYGKTSKTIKKLKKNKRYYVRVRTYAKVGKHRYYSKWSGTRRVRTR